MRDKSDFPGRVVLKDSLTPRVQGAVSGPDGRGGAHGEPVIIQAWAAFRATDLGPARPRGTSGLRPSPGAVHRGGRARP